MKIITLGNGFVASHLPYTIVSDRLAPNSTQIRDVLEKHKPDTIINAIGFCGSPNIDQCEIEVEKTFMVNTVIPVLLAIECKKLGIHLIHIGSGCVFYGPSPHAVGHKDTGWEENDVAAAISTYSRSKYTCDLALSSLPDTTILRIRMPISDKDTPRNFINKIRGYKQIINIPNSVTFLSDFKRCVEHVIDKGLTGIYHVVNPQPLSAMRVMQEYQKYVPSHTFDVITEEQLGKLTAAKRSNNILNGDKLLTTGFRMTNSEDALKECMKIYCQGDNDVE